ncbi:chromatin binding protein [Malassezia sp. CBS 17886]|nr:chromatin binding protein [Malassezia sp. CBS 17886]
MNAQLLNPFGRDTPERIEATLENAYANCFAYNGGSGLHCGTYLAVGRTDGYVAVWDLETKSVLRWLAGHVKTVTSLRCAVLRRAHTSWSPFHRYLATSSLDWNVQLWDLADGPGRSVRCLRFDAPVSMCSFSPRTSRALLVVLESRDAYVVQFPCSPAGDTQRPTMHTDTPGAGSAHGPSGAAAAAEPTYLRFAARNRGPNADSAAIPTPEHPTTTAVYSPDGRWIVAGTTKGALVVYDATSAVQCGEPVPIGSSSIRQLAFDAAGRHLVVNMNDRTLRTLSVMARGGHCSPTFTAQHKFQDLVGRTPWSGVAFSSDAEYVMGGAAHDASHNIYIWDRDAGVLVKILEGPREPLVSAQWHPRKPSIVSIASSGDVHVWTTKATEIWSAYAPGFEELEENVEYEEREDEFDLEDVDALSRKKQDEEEAHVNIFSMGPVPPDMLLRSLAPLQLHRHVSTLQAAIPPQPPVGTHDDDDQVAFVLPPILSEASGGGT